MTSIEYRRLGDLAHQEGISYGIVQPGTHDPMGVPMLRASDLSSASSSNELHRVSPEVERKFARTRIRGGELLITLVGSPGMTRVAGPELAGFNVARAVGVIRPAGVEARWLDYAFRTPTVKSQVAELLNTTVQATLNLTDLKSVRVPMPSLSVRSGITEVLGALDDKIAANRRVLEVGDDLIRQHYRNLTGLPTVQMGEVANNVRVAAGPEIGAPQRKYIGLDDMDKKSLWVQRWKGSEEATSTKSVFQSGDTLFGKLRPYFHKVGFVLEPGICSTDILVIRARRRDDRWVVAAAASSDGAVELSISTANGTRMPRANWASLSTFRMPDPDCPEVRSFSLLMASIAEGAAARTWENAALARTRDELLPLLMNGRITVKDAERAIEVVV